MPTKKILLLFLTLATPAFASDGLKVITTTPDLAALATAIGGEKNEVISIGKGTQDPHQIEAKPSFIVKLRTADLVLIQGLELESAWINSLIEGARNPKITRNSRGYLELAPLLEPIEIPHGVVSRSEGDIHPGGNPHFQLDPVRMGKAAIFIAERLGELDSTNKELYLKNAANLQNRLIEKFKEWKIRIEKTSVREVVSYHKTFAYFFERFGIKSRFFIEPKPGIPPTTRHLQSIIASMKQEKIRVVLVENYFNDDAIKKIKEEIPSAQGYQMPVAVGGAPNINSTEELIENLVKTIENASR